MQTIQVTGSNGKSATVNLLAAIFRAASTHRLGVFLPAPHPDWPVPPVCTVDGVPTARCSRLTPKARVPSTDRAVVQFAWESPAERLRQAGATWAVVEESTVALRARPDLAVGVITSICDDSNERALDRATWKVDRLALADTPLVVGAVPADCRDVITRTTADRGAELVWALENVEMHVTDFADGRPTIVVRTPAGTYTARLQSRGRYQLENATVAIRVAERCGIPQVSIEAGLAAAPPLFPRLTYVHRGEHTVLVDVMKNPRGAEVLRDYVLERHPNTPIVVRLQSYRAAVAAVLAPVGPMTFGDRIPDVPFCTVAGPYVADICADYGATTHLADAAQHELLLD